MDKHLIFVYGTLKKKHGGYAHQTYLSQARFVGDCCIPGVMVHLGRYPGLVPDEICRVTGEVYEVTAPMIQAVDRYEGYPDFYSRRKVSTPFGMAWAYYKNNVTVKDNVVCVDRGLWLGGQADRAPYKKVLDYYKNKRWNEPHYRIGEQPIVDNVIPESSPAALPAPIPDVPNLVEVVTQKLDIPVKPSRTGVM